MDKAEAQQQQAATLKRVRDRLEASILFYVEEKGKIPGPTGAQDILHLVQALEITCRCEQEALEPQKEKAKLRHS